MSGLAEPVMSAVASQWTGAFVPDKGRMAGRPLRKVVLGPGDLDRLYDLHGRILDGLAPGVLNRETRVFFAEHLESAGALLALAAEEGLVGYAVLGLPQASNPYNFGRFMGLEDGALGLVAHLDGVGVLPGWRGHGFHRLFAAARIDLARRFGRRHVLSTVAPTNADSWRNLFPFGLVGKRLQPMFAAGHMRYLLHLDLDAPTHVDMAGAVRVAADAVERQRKLVEAGYWAVDGDGNGPRATLVLAPRDGRP